MNTLRSLPYWEKMIKIVPLIFLLILAIIFAINFDFPEIKAYIQQHQEHGLILSICIYFLMAFTFIPSSPLTMFLSVLNGPVLSITASTIGNVLAALVQYRIGDTIIDVENFNEKRGKLPSFLRNLPLSSPIFLIAGRMFPGGTRGLSAVCGIHRVPFSTFLWTTFVAFLISAAFIAFGGAELIKLF